MSERVVKIHATIVTELTDDELFEFGVIYGQGLGRPSLAVAEVIESGWSWA